MDRLRPLRDKRVRQGDHEVNLVTGSALISHVIIELARITRVKLVARLVLRSRREEQPERRCKCAQARIGYETLWHARNGLRAGRMISARIGGRPGPSEYSRALTSDSIDRRRERWIGITVVANRRLAEQGCCRC